ncbi:hypothetical protein IB245_00205 [Pseudomonas sp. PDM02]|jgi:hypothetical protein|uniref:hypothetical protein n=1 Tax=unclassified Pseudomonas TaxID=196821 RepID=UPI0017856411|nr:MULTISPECIES: hypothetical protein [unclassified Pseudomonas]MBD9609913.1 hypothetical protein [Pseudomonas sp. PDM02]
MNVSESCSESNRFMFFEGYEEERFEEFVDVVLRALNSKVESRESGPYSVLVIVCYAGHKLVLTSGSFEGCFISMEKNVDGGVVKKITEAFKVTG